MKTRQFFGQTVRTGTRVIRKNGRKGIIVLSEDIIETNTNSYVSAKDGIIFTITDDLIDGWMPLDEKEADDEWKVEKICESPTVYCDLFNTTKGFDKVVAVIPIEEPIMIGNNAVKFDNDFGIKVGCTIVNKETVKKVYDRLFKNG